jgi:glycosyltransferase involved in cell wall biosynthesis
MKIAVYTIAKNEAANVARWAASCRDADYRIVTDTGSQDETVSELTRLGVTVKQFQTTPFRFDTSRNAAMEFIPDDADVCISLDMDEVLTPGWRQAVEQAWIPGASELKCTIVVDWIADGVVPNTTMKLTRAHARRGYSWAGAVHETLTTKMPRTIVSTDGFCIHQFQDTSKNRDFYLKFFEESLLKSPDDAKIVFRYACELFNLKRHEEAYGQFEKYVLNPNARNATERATAYIHIAYSLAAMRRPNDLVISSILKAIAENPSLREPWVHLASLSSFLGDWPMCYGASSKALTLELPPTDFSDPRPFVRDEPAKLQNLSASKLGLSLPPPDRMQVSP